MLVTKGVCASPTPPLVRPPSSSQPYASSVRPLRPEQRKPDLVFHTTLCSSSIICTMPIRYDTFALHPAVGLLGALGLGAVASLLRSLWLFDQPPTGHTQRPKDFGGGN